MLKTNASCQQSWLKSLASFKCLGGRLGQEPVEISDWRDRKAAERTASSFHSLTPTEKRGKREKKAKRMSPGAHFQRNIQLFEAKWRRNQPLSPSPSLASVTAARSQLCLCARTRMSKQERARDEGRGRRVYAQRREAPIQSLHLQLNLPAGRKMC